MKKGKYEDGGKVKPNAANTSPSASFSNTYLQYLKEQKSKQAAAKPTASKPSTAKSAAAKPAAPKTAAAKPVSNKPAPAKPSAPNTAAAKPSAPNTAAAKPSGKKLSEFEAAFAAARKGGIKVFEYKGKKYTTEYKEEKAKRLSKDKTKTAQATQAPTKEAQTIPAEPNNATAKLKEAIRNRDLAKADSLKSEGKTMKYGGKIATPMKGMKTSKSKPCK